MKKIIEYILAGLYGGIIAVASVSLNFWNTESPVSILAIPIISILTYAFLEEWKKSCGKETARPHISIVIASVLSYAMFGWLFSPSSAPDIRAAMVALAIVIIPVSDYLRNFAFVSKEEDAGGGGKENKQT